MLNIILVELLKQNFDINIDSLQKLPNDKSGVDVKLIFTYIRRAIIEKKKWDVLEEALLGLFSFNKFVMWNDIHSNSNKLEENPIIASLIEKRNKLESDEDMIDAREIDKVNPPMDFAIPLDVDSSQMEAVVESGRGKSFILHGSPGTGKSQTITNMIANALFQGKRILFVAEKMAALSVVQSRLEKIGLVPFCLELHSNKVSKKHFLEQMEMVLNAKKIKSPDDYEKSSKELFSERQKLISYMEASHHRTNNGLSLYDCISEYLLIDEEELDDDPPLQKDLNAEFIAKCKNMMENTDTILHLVGQPGKHPLGGLEPIDNKIATFDEIKSVLLDFKKSHDSYEKQKEDFNAATPFDVATEKDLIWLDKLATIMENTAFLNRKLLELGDDETCRQGVKTALHWARIAKRY